MTKTTMKCDHCGTKLDSLIDYDDIEIRANHITINADLCCDCFNELCGVIKKFVKKGGSRGGKK